MEWKELKKNFNSISEEERTETKLLMAIVERRKELGYSQRELADLVGMQQSSIARMESILVAPKFITIIKLCKALDMTIVFDKKETTNQTEKGAV